MLKRTIAGLMQDQPVRQHMDPEGAAQIENYVAKIEALLGLQQPFHVVRILEWHYILMHYRSVSENLMVLRSTYYILLHFRIVLCLAFGVFKTPFLTKIVEEFSEMYLS